MGVHMVDDHPKEAAESCVLKFHQSSSASRLASVPLRLFKSRSKSQSRAVSTNKSYWVSEGNCFWRDNDGHVMQLKQVPLLDITESERIALQRFGISKLNSINLGCHIELPKTENITVHHSKRRPMLLRKKAATTNFLEGKEKEKGFTGHGTVFGISLSQCVANNRMRLTEEDMRRQGHCEEVLSALRLSVKDHETTTPSREGSTESLTCVEQSDASKQSSQNRISSRGGSTSSLYGGSCSQVPIIVDNCISFLETKGLHTLGLFRVSGSKRRVRQLREDLDRNPGQSINDTSHPHDVAQLLKEFFRELPEPLLTRELYKAFIEIQKICDSQLRLQSTRWLLYLLPSVHRDTLAALLSFLSKVADSSEDCRRPDGTRTNGNKMNSSNLATVFGPNILRLSKGSSETTFSVQCPERAQERSDVILTVQSLIDNYTSLLQVPASDLDSAYRNLITEDPELLNALLRRRLTTSGNETKSEIEVESCSSQCDEYAVGFMDKSAREIFFSTEINHKETHYSHEWDVKSRVRPLIFPEYGDYNQTDRVQHQETKKSSKHDYESAVTLSQHRGVSASFTVTRAAVGSSPVPHLKIYESDQCASSKARRVPYGKIRHMTTPSYVSEEMSITITIPTRKHEKQGLLLRGLPSFCGSHSNLTQCSQVSSKTDRRLQEISKTSGQYLCPPAPQETWKRQEIIASEHTQL